jgi:hypothetical protein
MHGLLEEYLGQVAEPLRQMPPTLREEELRELSQHLQSAMSVHQEQGQAEEESAKSAIAQFGASDTLGASLFQAWKHRNRRKNLMSLLGAATTTFALSAMQSGLAWHLYSLSAYRLPIGVDYALISATCLMAGYFFPKGCIWGWACGTSAFPLTAALIMVLETVRDGGACHSSWAVYDVAYWVRCWTAFPLYPIIAQTLVGAVSHWRLNGSIFKTT